MSSDVPTQPASPFAGLGVRAIGPGVKLALVFGLLLVLLIPLMMIDGVISERENRHAEAGRDIAAGWGQPQAILGPLLELPYRVPAPRQQDETGPMRWVHGTVLVQPAELHARVALSPQTRRRGLFETVVYGAEIALEGSFSVPALNLPDEPRAEFLWSQATLVSGASDLRLAGAEPRMTWNGTPLTGSDSDQSLPHCLPQGALRWHLPLTAAPEPGRAIAFSGTMSLRGTQSLRVLPLARQTRVAISGAWPTPSFIGASLPDQREVTETGFSAEWQMTSRPIPARAPQLCSQAQLTGASQGLGVSLLEAVPTYRMINRVSKYGALFLALAFMTYAMFEMLGGQRIHLVQYGMVGMSIVLFPLLLLAVGEPLGFGPAYLIAAAAVVAQASLYSVSVTRSWWRGGIFAGVLGAVFALLYVILSLESFALLAGSVALFVALSVVMAMTRRVAWGGR